MASPYTPNNHPLVIRAAKILRDGRLEGLLKSFTVDAKYRGVIEALRGAMGRLLTALVLGEDPTPYEIDLQKELKAAEEASKYVEALDVVEQAKVVDPIKKFEI